MLPYQRHILSGSWDLSSLAGTGGCGCEEDCDPTTRIEEVKKVYRSGGYEWNMNGIQWCNKPLRPVCSPDPCSSSNIKSRKKFKAPGSTSALKWDTETK
eukprot:s104_g39.t1